ncbi:uncharacterized protein TRIADDRAFT_52346 [Trichoplax adhaerens]|uniref:Uncharacterized protein n=1 Tax=Trichoplax adhaerens TaxID=10228 RepID=B3RI15_TRIAD|nr:hypothetical protein TRIADDRAFT_52346 [Trichoplax adhaerens]EDV28957.1 hypothetical protein TRIADDRAFT_52346 [Trichoplax adhaerens]|eukprot:XP_002108159.1 hypothetical protein TRIADDRAFT_52346 [Trichoplax adhaerens]
MDIKIANTLGRLCVAQGNVGLALECYEKLVDMIIKLKGDGAVQLIPIYWEIGNISLRENNKMLAKGSGNMKKVTEAYLQAYNVAVARYPAKSPQIADASYRLGKAYLLEKSTESETLADEYLQRSYEIYSKHDGSSSNKCIKIQEAIVKLRPLVETKRKAFGEDSIEVANSYKLLGIVNLSQGEMLKAIKPLTKCLYIYRNILGSTHKKTEEVESMVEMIAKLRNNTFVKMIPDPNSHGKI